MEKGMKKINKKDISAQAEEMLKSYADGWAGAYAAEAEELLRNDEQYRQAAEKYGSYRRRSLKKCLLRCAAVLVCAIFIASIAVPIPQAHAWRVWWLDLVTNENAQDIDVRANKDYVGEYYVSELPEGFELEKERRDEEQYMIKYVNTLGESIVFIQSINKTTDNHIDNEQTNYQEELIGEFQVFVGKSGNRTLFEMTTDDAFLLISTDAEYETGVEFIEHLHKVS